MLQSKKEARSVEQGSLSLRSHLRAVRRDRLEVGHGSGPRDVLDGVKHRVGEPDGASQLVVGVDEVGGEGLEVRDARVASQLHVPVKAGTVKGSERSV